MSKITREALLHIPRSNYCYGYDENTLHIRLRAKKGEVKSAFLRIGDQYIWDELEGGGGNLGSGGKVWISSCDIKMEKELETEYFDYFIAKYNPPTKRSRYCFIIDEKLLYTEKYIINLGNEDNQKKLNDISSFFAYSYLNKIDVLKIPSWVKDTVWYQIFPDRFANGDESINPKDTKTWGTPPTNDNFMGGDLQGVIDHLDYLKDLGVTGLYFCPITMGYTNHRYDTIDYMKIDPHLGDKKTLKKLVKEAHKRGMKIMLDAVFNHIGYYSKQWQDVIKNKEKSKYKDWFYIKDINKVDTPLNKIDSKNIPYETFSCVAEMPKLNTENEEVIEYLLEVGRYFIKEFDIDAWRLDVSNEVDHSFWRQFRKEVKKIKKQLIQDVVDNMQDEDNDPKKAKVMEQNQRLIQEAKDKINSLEDEALDIPRDIVDANRNLLIETVKVCYNKINSNKEDLEVLDKWINATRVKLKKNILIKQDKEEANNRMYSSMHDILGADVMKELDRINEE